jgi:hypothetical protein
MGYGEEALTEHEKIALSAWRSLQKNAPAIFNTLIACLHYICSKEGIECSGLTLLIRPNTPEPEEPTMKKKKKGR